LAKFFSVKVQTAYISGFVGFHQSYSALLPQWESKGHACVPKTLFIDIEI
jgi:hypothetical protein